MAITGTTTCMVVPQRPTASVIGHYAGGPRRPPPPQLQLRRSRDLAHASIPLAQTPWGLTGRAWLQAGAQQAVIAVDPSFNSLGIDSRNELIGRSMKSKKFMGARSSNELQRFNSLWPSDAIWLQGSWSTLVQVMVCCLTAPSHYLNQCWLIITKVQWCSSEGNFAWGITAIIH